MITSAGGKPPKSVARSGDARGSVAVVRVTEVQRPVASHVCTPERRPLDVGGGRLVERRIDEQLEHDRRSAAIAGELCHRCGEVRAGARAADCQQRRVEPELPARSASHAVAARQSSSAAGNGCCGASR